MGIPFSMVATQFLSLLILSNNTFLKLAAPICVLVSIIRITSNQATDAFEEQGWASTTST
jgi:hypothetical protein